MEQASNSHITIIQVKSLWRAIPTHMSKWHIQAYFDKFCFRVNHSLHQTIFFHKTIERMVPSDPVYQSEIKQQLNV
jgi:hypothetical protein